MLAEVLLIAFVYFVDLRFHAQWVLHTTTWYTAPTAGGFELSLAGMWYTYLSLPIYQFLLFRWYFRS